MKIMDIHGTWKNKENGSNLIICEIPNNGDHYRIDFFDSNSKTTISDKKVLIVNYENKFILNSTNFGDDSAYILFRNDNEIVLNFKGKQTIFNLLSKRVEFLN
jgi:hypothetical protein